MARGGADRWWARSLASYEDPISLEPLRTLRYPPFQLRANPDLPHGTASDWFDGQVLASYLISTGNFYHPISRRELERPECVALDQYLRQHNLQHKLAVAEAFDNREAYKKPETMPPGSRTHALRAEADMVLQSLFSASTSRREERARSSRPRSDGQAVQSEGNMTIVDDDQRPSQAAAMPLDARGATERVAERAAERVAERPVERTAERTVERTAERTAERTPACTNVRAATVGSSRANVAPTEPSNWVTATAGSAAPSLGRPSVDTAGRMNPSPIPIENFPPLVSERILVNS